MSRKIFRSVISVAMAVLFFCLFFISGFLYDYYNDYQISRLKEELSLASAGMEMSDISYLEGLKSDSFRFTYISPNGDVLYDSEIKTGSMENHLDREEIKEAMQNGNGSSARYSKTLTDRTFYEAVLLNNGNILRISLTQVTLVSLIIGMLPAICAIILISALIAVLLSQKIAKSIVKPLESLDLENPESNDTYEELAPVLSKLCRQRRQIDRQMRELRRKSDEFEQITAALNEGMVLLDKNGAVISINSAAEKLFGVDKGMVGHSFLALDRGEAMRKAVKCALSGEHCEFREEKNGGEYQFMLNPIVSDGKRLGAVVLCIDVTETVFAERNRREFTANVSHELKTPLQSIIGSAELLENGLVKAEDTERFIENIRSEAVRLVSLINDIIRLSQIDEQSEMQTETVDLYAEAKETAAILSDSARKRDIHIAVVGEACTITGVRRYIYEILYNLCDNAIRYNKDGGDVEIAVKKDGEKAVIAVKDTGMGIPPEHQSRIFERFYRVDKSHSKDTGGTGLGLSIVKHAVAYHGGTVSLESDTDKGTAVTVEFPFDGSHKDIS